ncbi:amidohydrolase [Alteriqipengyuania sp. WL0013]|nr:amidohydrolase [Alteriqipengyuania sp. WL0013]MEB3415831.1 amidohydrolase [Alteriqipengyuania sp. WL0013]
MLKTLLSAATAAIALIAAPAEADVLLDNVQGITVDREGNVTRFEALVIGDDGRITHVLARGERRPQTDYREDGQGRIVLPGMIDSHGHVMGIGLGALSLDLMQTASLGEAQAEIAAYAARFPGRPWLLGRGWNQETWGLGRFPTAAELDLAESERPVWMERVDGHAGWANSAALRLAGITKDTRDPAGGRIERDAAGNPTGVLVDAAMELVSGKIPPPRGSDRDAALSEAQRLLVARGVTAIADMGTSIEDWQTFRRAGDTGGLYIRIMSYGAGIDQTVLIGGSGPSPWLYGDKLRLNGVKLYLDGALGSRGAVLKEDYADHPGNRGLALMSPAQLRNALTRAAIDGYQPAVHAIGDGANLEALRAIDDVAPVYPGDIRWRIEHAQVVDPADMGMFGNHGIVASMQPVHQTSDRLMAEARLGADRLDGAYAWHSIAATGAPLAFGSDAPVELPDPWTGLAVAISREDADGQPFGGWYPQEAVNRGAALAAYTAGGAYAGFAQGRFGQLAVGEQADFVVVDRDPMISSPAEIRETQVLETWIGGRKVYDARTRSGDAPEIVAEEEAEIVR